MTGRASDRAVFLDKDGTLVRDVPYNADPALIEWRPGVGEALGRLQDAGFLLVIATNQSGLAHGHFTERELQRYFGELMARLSEQGVSLASVLYCPHHPEASVPGLRRFCACRKPNPGMLVRASRGLGLDLSRSWMVGDLLDDVEAGGRAGCRTALVHHDGNERIPPSGVRSPDVVAPTLAVAVARIVSADEAVA